VRQVQTHDAVMRLQQRGVHLRTGAEWKRPKDARARGHTWKFAGEPDSDCTFTPHLAGSKRKASSARFWHRLRAEGGA